MRVNPYYGETGFQLLVEIIFAIYFYIMLLKQVTKSNTLIKN
jgi:hypothetical protein